MKNQTPQEIKAELIALKKQIKDSKEVELLDDKTAKQEFVIKQAKDIVFKALNKAVKHGVYDLKEAHVIIQAFEQLI